MQKTEEYMLQIKDTLISLDLVEKKFVCDLDKCKGACCVKGDSGAPLTDQEVELLPKIIDEIKPFLRDEGVNTINERGTHVIDIENDKVTPLINGNECAYAIFENGIAKCGIEKAYLNHKISFQKPLSCHLYPVRIKKYNDFTAVNYDKWDICAPAEKKGKYENVLVQDFLKESLIRKFGSDWYKHLKIASKKLKDEPKAL